MEFRKSKNLGQLGELGDKYIEKMNLVEDSHKNLSHRLGILKETE